MQRTVLLITLPAEIKWRRASTPASIKSGENCVNTELPSVLSSVVNAKLQTTDLYASLYAFFIRLRRYDAMISGPPIITRRQPYLNPISGLPRALHNSFMLRPVADSCELRRCRRVVVCCFIINMATRQLVLDLDPSFVHCE